MSDCAVEEMAKTVEADAASIMEKLDIGNVAPSADSGEGKEEKEEKEAKEEEEEDGRGSCSGGECE